MIDNLAYVHVEGCRCQVGHRDRRRKGRRTTCPVKNLGVASLLDGNISSK